jgi:nitrate/TMAO reductase-like tetraheme cytochrome c subunit
MRLVIIGVVLVGVGSFLAFAQEMPFGDAALGTKKYEQYEKPQACKSCHVDFYQQWTQSMMSQAYTHHWDEIEYFKLAVPHAEKDEMVAGVKAGCNGCHAPMAFMAGNVPPPRPEENTRANEAVACDICHTIKGAGEDVVYNFNYISNPGRLKYGNKEGKSSPHHDTQYLEFTTTPKLCGSCHNEKSPYGVWVKSTQLEWEAGPYAKENVRCQDCHMPKFEGQNAKMSKTEKIAQHYFPGAHVEAKLKGVIEMVIYPLQREVGYDEPAVVRVQLYNAKAGHKVPSGSVEDRIMWLHVTATDSKGKVYHLAVDKKGFEGEEYTIAADVLAYQDMGIPLNLPDFKGVQRDGVPVGDRIFRMPYFDPQGRMTIMQWNTKSQGVDYRIGPREAKSETFTWEMPADIPLGKVYFTAELNYSKLVKPVADFLEVPPEESEPVLINKATTWIEVYD